MGKVLKLAAPGEMCPESIKIRTGIVLYHFVKASLRSRQLLGLLAGIVCLPLARGADSSDSGALPTRTNNLAQTSRTNQTETASLVSTNVPVPKPGLADRTLLPVAFTKPAPTSVADLRLMEQKVKELVHRVTPAVVDVQIGNGSGSGVIISADGLVLTAGHVCGSANKDVRLVFPDGRKAKGKTLGVNRTTDTGLIRITDKGNWPHVPVGDLEKAHLGDWVLALGNPGGFDLNRSLVVRLGRIIHLGASAVQTDCTISPGDSGGPLFDMYGRVIGIHSFISTSLSDNFHVPITRFFESWDQMIRGAPAEGDSAPRAWAGARGTDTPEGCEIRSVDEKGPAYKAGLRKGDLVLKVDGREIKAAATFQRWADEGAPGDTLELEVKRGEKVMTMEVKLGAPPRRK
jgi:serine protease Do